jgi:hypothetical protein
VPGVQVGAAAADVGEGEDPFLRRLQRGEEVEHVVAVGVDVGEVLDQRVRGASALRRTLPSVSGE